MHMCMVGRGLGRLREMEKKSAKKAEEAYAPSLVWDPGKKLLFLVVPDWYVEAAEYRVVRQREGLVSTPASLLVPVKYEGNQKFLRQMKHLCCRGFGVDCQGQMEALCAAQRGLQP